MDQKKGSEERRRRENLVFAINGERFEVSTIDPSTTLLHFLRTQTPFKSVKLGCGEVPDRTAFYRLLAGRSYSRISIGGCGACLVLISKYDPILDQVEDFTASSCLTLLCSIHGCSITTSDGIGNSKDGFHPIHERIAGFHATQCGFCTPGMCVSLFGALVNAEKITDRPDPPNGFSKATASEAERAISGNLCRCTGYRSLSDACKSFAADVDMEDLGLNSFWRKGEENDVKLSKLPKYDHNHKKHKFPEFLKEVNPNVLMNFDEKDSWHSPTSLMELQSLLKANNNGNGRLKLVVSNTGMGYYKDIAGYDKYINLKGIHELSRIHKDASGIEIGATVTLFKAIEALRQKSDKCDYFQSDFNAILEKIADHLNKIASGFIRNTATIGGNLVMAQKNDFPSDIATVLLAVDSSVHIMNGSQFEWVSLEEFLKRPPLDLESVVLSIKIPSRPVQSDDKSTKIMFETFRAAPRPLGNALPYLNAAFLAEVSSSKEINACRLCFGAYGTKHAIRAKKVEELLVGKVLSVSVIYEAINLLKAIVLPEEGTSRIAYRSSLASGFLFKFFSPLIGDTFDNNYLNGYSNLKENGNNNGYVHNHDDKIPTLLSSGKQEIQVGDEYLPVGEPIQKAGAALQASGEAVYVDDIPSPPNCLYGAYITSAKPLARVKSIKLEPELQKDGSVKAIISYKDIPEGGENLGLKSVFGTEPLFAHDNIAKCIGDRIGFLVADNQKLANMAANSAIVEYDYENLEPPILSIEEAVERSSFFEFPIIGHLAQVGDLSEGMAKADHKILSSEIKLGSQYYFYMETQTALAIPDEDNCLVVYSSCQGPETTHSTIAACLNIPENNVRVITRRVGGGFGGKFTKAIPVATACALAAHKLRRPVRMYMNRKADMMIAGGRHPMKITYNVGFRSNGKVTALELKILVDAGIYEDVSMIMAPTIIGSLKKYDWGVLSFDLKICKTNLPSRSAMRAPGDLQGSYIAEAIIENVASSLSLDVDCVRNINFHTYESLCTFYKGNSGEPLEYTLASIWNKIVVSASYEKRSEMVKEFNKTNIWRKRGISRTPAIYEVSARPSPGKTSIFSDGSIVVEVPGIEIGQGLWTKVKQIAAFALSAIRCDGSRDLLGKIRVVQSDTVSMIQGGITGGSTTSESSCEAVRLSCNVLVERLMPLKEKLEQEKGTSVNWETLILQAHRQVVNLSATSFFYPGTVTNGYLNYGVAVSEVEIDLITGETTVLQTDIIYDCGKSLNPAVDLGQIEGAFVQGLGFFMLEEYEMNDEGLILADGTWNYKIPTIDTIPRQFNVEIISSGQHQHRVLSSKASGEPPLLLAASVHCAIRAAVIEARKQLLSWKHSQGLDSTFLLDVPATMPVVKEFSGLDIVETYLKWKMAKV
ncbi:indole-3-acetaldehyde oxidase-like [Senna tora]|uniref:indole-3-acetaldehyde oxidase n=1 Tax=Senna tora TaxID=362788 RepID=A0A834W9L7_9FABA|nr:indole-3-acetaldehyde oxidase-like [Senna tora]